MNVQEAIAYIHSCHWQESRPGLERMRELLRALGDPQRGMKILHVAGTNGKGSTCACLASVLQAAGHRVGLNTSPYLLRFQERIRVDGQEIADQALAALVERVRPVAEGMADRPTEFELITAIALLYFRERRCDIVVLEVGLGGALDASNVIDTPEVAVLTAMGMDHGEILGPTLGEIAAAKAGIIKPGGAVVSSGGCDEADGVFRAAAKERGALLTEADATRLGAIAPDLDGMTVTLAPYGPLRLSLTGLYQAQNALLAVTVLEVLRQKGWSIPDDAIRQGLAQVRWPGRFEVLCREGPAVFLDGAHNPQGIRAAVESLEALRPGGKVVFLLGVLADKDVGEMLAPLLPLAEAVVTVTPDSPRAMPAEALRELLLPLGAPVCACATVAEGVYAARMAAGSDGAICALGSLYLSAAVRRAVKEQERTGV